MLKSNAIIINCKNHKNDKFDEISNYVRFLVRHTEYERVLNNSNFKSLRTKAEESHMGVDVLTCDISTIEDTFTAVELDQFKSLRDELSEIKSALSEIPVNLDSFNALSLTDKSFICIQAHTAMPSIKLDKSILDHMDLSKPIKEYYSKGSIKGIKDLFRAIFLNVVGQEGELFYGVKLRKSDFADTDIRTCLAYFRGGAKRTVTKKGDIESYGQYSWVCKDGDVNAQVMAITNLFAVVLDAGKDYEVIREKNYIAKNGELKDKVFSAKQMREVYRDIPNDYTDFDSWLEAVLADGTFEAVNK